MLLCVISVRNLFAISSDNSKYVASIFITGRNWTLSSLNENQTLNPKHLPLLNHLCHIIIPVATITTMIVAPNVQ